MCSCKYNNALTPIATHLYGFCRESAMVRPSGAPANTPREKKTRKKKRFRPGTKALREIRCYQGPRSINPVLPFNPFSKLVREIAHTYNKEIRWKRSAIEALREDSQQYVSMLMQCTNHAAIHRGNQTIDCKDMQFALQMATAISTLVRPSG